MLKKLYTIKKLIGQGTDGKIYEVVHISTNKRYALKLVEVRCGSDVEWFRNEIGIQMYVSECP